MKIPLGYTDGNYEKAKDISSAYNFEINNQALPRLNLTSARLELLMKNFSPLFVDFGSKTIQKRKIQAKSQGLVRACKPGKGVSILDLTAGWGRDSALLASLGAKVTMIERNAVIAALLADGLSRIDPNLFKSDCLSLIHIDAIDYLINLKEEDYPDIIYIDPMHPERQKSALVKKDMQALQYLLEDDEDKDVSRLINLAIGRAKKRVVVKWPQRLPPVVQPKHKLEGSTVRFDMY
jgi:16S rRNA (guanine1516-N2)-methyltransferase